MKKRVVSLCMACILLCTPLNTKAFAVQKVITVHVGDTVKLSFDGTKEKIKWYTSNKKAKIIKKKQRTCIVKAKATGKVIITGKSKHDLYEVILMVKKRRIKFAYTQKFKVTKNDIKESGNAFFFFRKLIGFRQWELGLKITKGCVLL